MMNRKGIGIIVLVAIAVIAFVVGLAAGYNLVGAQLAPPSAFIRAHSCDADGTCETNSIMSSGRLVVGQGDNGEGMAYFGSGNNGSIGLIALGSIRTNGFYVLGSTWEWLQTQNDGVAFRHNTDDVLALQGDGSVRLPFSSGDGTAYACFNANGRLFRSNTPCR